MNILVTIDNRYVEPLAMMLRSYIETNNDSETDLYIAHSSITDENLQYIDSIVEGTNVRVHSLRITEKWFSKTPVLERLPDESFYRLMAFHFLPRTWTRYSISIPTYGSGNRCNRCTTPTSKGST